MGGASLPPGFRFHPTDDELVGYYLKRKVEGLEIELEVIPVIDLYKFDPWELPEKSFLPNRDMEWFFFCPRDRKYPNGSRTNRATKAGYWKATGKDRKVVTQSAVSGYRKTLVFYRGRAPSGDRTDWIMHEYRLCDDHCQGSPSFQGGYALCRVVKKNENAQKMSDFHGEAKSKTIGSSSSNGDFTSMMISNEQPMTMANDFVSQTTSSHNIIPMAGYEPPLMATDPSSVWVSPDLILDSSKEFSQVHQATSGYFQQHQFESAMTSWQPYDSNNFSSSSSYSNFTEEIEPANDFSGIGSMSPYSEDVNYMGFWGTEDITYHGYDHNNSLRNPNSF